MDISSEYKKLRQINKDIYCEDKLSNVLPEVNGERGEGWEDAEESALEILSGEDDAGSTFFVMGEFSDYHESYAFHYAMCDDECVQGRCGSCQEEFALSSAYAYLETTFHLTIFDNYTPMGTLMMHEVGFTLAKQIIAGWWREANSISSHIFDALQRIIVNEKAFVDGVWEWIDYEMSWFMLELSASVFNKSYTKDPKVYPTQSTYPYYQKVLKEWDTQDLTRVDELVSLLCDLHLQDAIKGEGKEDLFYECIEGEYMFPHTALVWLKIREYKGLDNPVELNHPLMNAPSMAMCFEGSLEYPDELPYVKELYQALIAEKPEIVPPKFFVLP